GVIGLRDCGVCLGKWVHCESIVFGLDCDVNVGLWLVKMYASFGCVKDARKVFDGMCVRDVAVWNAMVSGYCKVEEFEKARELFEAVEVFRRMRVDGVKPDEVTMVAVLSACAQLGALELGEWVHGYINEHNLRKSVSFNNALIDMYAKSGNIKKAMEVFENMKDRCVITWTTVIAGLALHGFGKEALEIFSRMEKSHVKPNDVTLIAVMSACRAGCLSEAQELLKQMPFEPNAAIWGSLLAASRLYGNVELVMRDNGVKKMSGASCIELNSRVHEFVSGNGSHPLPVRISEVLSWLNRHMDLKRKVKIIDFVSLELQIESLTFITLNTIGNRVRSVYLSKMNSDEVVKMLQEFPKTMSNLNLTAADTPVKYDFQDTEWIQKQGVLLERYPDERVALVGRSVMPMLSSGFDAQGIANIFVLAYHLKAPGTSFVSYIYNPDESLPVTEGKPVRDLKDVFDFGIRNRVALEETGDPTREAALYSCIVASLLRLFTKPASNYVALEKIDSRFAFGEAEKVTLYGFLYMSNSGESHKELKKFLYDTHLLHCGMHIVSIIEGLCDVFKCTPESIIIAMSDNLTPHQTKCFACLLKLLAQNDENHQKKMWMYAKLFDETFMYHLQTKTFKILIYTQGVLQNSRDPRSCYMVLG
nr:hypothetical protein [Tanacetum cinerariifolium]